MNRISAVTNSNALANVAMMMYQDTIITLADYGVVINLSIRINTEMMDLVKVYAMFDSLIVPGAKIKTSHHDKLDADYVEISWDID